jgi:S1-C subfamily serine protease
MRPYASAKASTVAICLVRKDGTLRAMGSGVNVDPRGAVLTCKHVIEGTLVPPPIEAPPPRIPRPTEGVESGDLATYHFFAVFTHLEDGKVVMKVARPLCMSGLHDYDIAVIRLKPDEQLPFAEAGDSDGVSDGDSVITCGFPLSSSLQPGAPIRSILTQGIIAGVWPHEAVLPRERLLLDMTLNPGNSGGGLFDASSGQVVGIVNMEIHRSQDLPSGIGCAVPVNFAKPMVERLLRIPEEDILAGRVSAANALGPEEGR